jgi:predicted HNH restriction endonuclease
MPTLASSNPPEFQQYIAAFQAVNNLTDHHIQILQIHYDAPEQKITAKQLSQAIGYSHHTTANMMYGRLARLVGEQLGYSPEPEKLGTLVTFEKRKGEWHWVLRPEVAQALETLGWVVRSTTELSNEAFYEKIFNELVYDQDNRSPPDNRRWAQFKIGWENATLQRRYYTDETLNAVLTWNNLGYRFGAKLGHRSELEINKVYDFLAQRYLIKGAELSTENTARFFPDELDSSEIFREGAVRQVSVNAYERDPKARQKCIDYYGSSCSVCDFNFGKVFGQFGEGFIHVHHLRPISEIAEEYNVDPVKDLRPVCPNCHAMIHRRSPPLSIEEIKGLLDTSDRSDFAT